MLAPGPVGAMSTALARFVEPAVARAGVSQLVHLAIHYFPGGGEAVVGAMLEGGAAATPAPAAVRSSLGRADLVGQQVRVDYGDKPLDRAVIDTLALRLDGTDGPRRFEWRLEVYSTAGGRHEPAFRTSVELPVEEALQASLAMEPSQVFAGERVALRLAVRNDDRAGRALTGLRMEWPEGLTASGEQARIGWDPPLAPAATDTVTNTVQVAADIAGRLEIPVRVDAATVIGSPAGPLSLEVWPLPRVRLEIEGDALLLGRHGVVNCVIHNPGQTPIELDGLRLETGTAFERVRAVAGESGAALPSCEPTAGREPAAGPCVQVGGVRRLAAGAEFRLRVESRPQRVGPHRWRVLARPPGRDGFIPLAGPTEVVVLRTASPRDTVGLASAGASDLEMLQAAVQAALEERLLELPVPAGTPVRLVSAESRSDDWVVADVLARHLLRQGYQVRLEPDGGREPDCGLLRYRVVGARLVYVPRRGRWRPWRSTAVRQASADVFLQFEDGAGELLCTEQLHAWATDTVAGRWLGQDKGDELVARTVVASQSKLLERGLAAALLGGLAYIFFVL